MARASESKTGLVGAIAVVLIGVALFWGGYNKLRVAELRTQLADAEQKMAAMVAREELDQALQRAERLERGIERLQSEAARAASPEEAPEAAASPSTQGEGLAGLLGAMAGAGKESDDAGEGPANPLLRMFGGAGGAQMAEYGARMVVDMQYGDFFEELDLSPEVEQEVRDIIAESLKDAITQAMEMMQEGTMDPQKGQELEQEVTERLREELSQVLTADEMVVWEEYEETKDERMLARGTEMQLSAFAPGLTPESREIAAQIVTDEMLALRESGMAREDPQAVLDMQRDAYERARDRLADELDEEQLGHFDNFIERQGQMAEMAFQMMQSMGEQENQEE